MQAVLAISLFLWPYVKAFRIFLQVTNPAIDPLREGLVMSLEVNLGKRENLLEVDAKNADQVYHVGMSSNL
jgi:glutamate synthase (ferredoxin)